MTDLRQAAEAFLNDWEDHSHPNIYGDFDDELLRSAEALRAALDAPHPGIADVVHASDCAIHNMPAYPAGPCDCGAARMAEIANNLWCNLTEPTETSPMADYQMACELVGPARKRAGIKAADHIPGVGNMVPQPVTVERVREAVFYELFGSDDAGDAVCLLSVANSIEMIADVAAALMPMFAEAREGALATLTNPHLVYINLLAGKIAHPTPDQIKHLWPGLFADARAEAVADKDAAYEERNRVVAALARIFPSGVARTDIPGWLPEWHGCVYIDTPQGQLSWHYHDSQAHLFAGLPPYAGEWDGHTTDEKYQRVARLTGAEAREAGRRAGLEDAAGWHAREAEQYRRVSTSWPDISVVSRADCAARAHAHDGAAATIRALAGKAPAP